MTTAEATKETGSAEIGAEKRKRIIGRVQALMTKTVENGCTEAEALAAAAKVDELMREHDLTYADVNVEDEVRGEVYGARRRKGFGTWQKRGRRKFPETQWVCTDIAAYWDCRSWHSGVDLVFFGSKDDTEQAFNMLDLIGVAMDGECGRYKSSPGRDPNGNWSQQRVSFLMGMAIRVCERLREMKRARSGASTTGTALIVVKGQIVTEKFAAYCKQHNMHIGKGRRGSRRSVDYGAFGAGQSAGSRVNLGGSAVHGPAVRAIGRT